VKNTLPQSIAVSDLVSDAASVPAASPQKRRTWAYRCEDISWYGIAPTVDLSPDSRSLAFCLHGASQTDDDIYVMINAYWQELGFQIQEGAPQDRIRVADTDLPSPDDFSEHGLPLQQSIYQVAPRSIVVLVRAK